MVLCSRKKGAFNKKTQPSSMTNAFRVRTPALFPARWAGRLVPKAEVDRCDFPNHGDSNTYPSKVVTR